MTVLSNILFSNTENDKLPRMDHNVSRLVQSGLPIDEIFNFINKL